MSCMMPTSGSLAQALRQCFHEWVEKNGRGELIELKRENGVFVFDMSIPTDRVEAEQMVQQRIKEISAMDTVNLSGNRRQAAQL